MIQNILLIYFHMGIRWIRRNILFLFGSILGLGQWTDDPVEGWYTILLSLHFTSSSITAIEPTMSQIFHHLLPDPKTYTSLEVQTGIIRLMEKRRFVLINKTPFKRILKIFSQLLKNFSCQQRSTPLPTSNPVKFIYDRTSRKKC